MVEAEGEEGGGVRRYCSPVDDIQHNNIRLITPTQFVAGYLRRYPDGTVRHCSFRLLYTLPNGDHVIVEPEATDDPRGYG